MPRLGIAKIVFVIQTAALTLVSVGMATLVHALIVLLAGRLRPVFDSPEKEGKIGRFFAFLLASVAIWFAVSTGNYST